MAAADEALRSLLQTAAHVRYREMSQEERAEVRGAFYELDGSKDGQISVLEFLRSAYEPSVRDLYAKLFDFLDVDASGFLEFDEYLTLHYLTRHAAARFCDGCGARPVILLGFTCRTCWSLSPPHSPHGTFDLCLLCYSSRSFSHPHSDIVDISAMYNTLLSATNQHSLHQVQCSICGDFHRMNIKGALVGGNHIQESEESPSTFVCEWCSCWFCNKCGKYFHGDTSGPTAFKWLKTDLCCNSCGAHGNLTNLDKIFQELQTSEVCEKCSNCSIKIKKGLLWATYKDSTSSKLASSSTDLKNAVCLAEGDAARACKNLV